MNLLEVKIIKNGYHPPLGNYSLHISHRGAFKKLTFETRDGIVGTENGEVFFPLDSISLLEDETKYQVYAIKKTRLAKKFNKNNILAEFGNHYIIMRDSVL